MSKKLKRVIEILNSLEFMDKDKISLSTRFYPGENCVIYRFQCIKKDYDLEMSLSIIGYDNSAEGIVEFGQSFNNDYKTITYKGFKALLNKANKHDIL